MAHSYAEQANISCQNCGNTFRTKVWVLVDVTEQPDLMERIRTGSLHNMVCPKCGATMMVAAPLLLYRPHDTQPFLFSPAIGKSAEDEEGTNQAINLLRILRQLLGPDWRDDWLDNEAIVSIRRAVLPNYLSRSTETLYKAHSPSLEQAVTKFLEADTWEMKRQTVANHSELLNEGADFVLSKYIDRDYSLDIKEALIEHRNLLRRCREVGVEAAFAERVSDPNFILQKIYEAEQSCDWYSCIMLCRQALPMADRDSDTFNLGYVIWSAWVTAC